MSSVAHVFANNAQLGGGSPATRAQTPCKSFRVTVAQPGSAATPALKAAAWSEMHAEYCATVNEQDVGMLPQLATAGGAARQAPSSVLQFC
jgi:hypothetical protein